MNCKYCIEAITLQTADICHVDSYLFHCSVFSGFYLKMLATACIKKNLSHFKSSQKI